MDILEELKSSKADHERRMKLTTRFSFLIDKAIEQSERYENVLKEIAEYGGIDMLGKTCAGVAKEALNYEIKE